MRWQFWPGLILAALAALPAAAAVEHGKKLFETFAACHTDKPNSLGPNLAGVFGRKAGSREDFRYSPAMQRTSFTWDEQNLREYLTNPQAKVKGNRMPLAGIANPADIDDLIAYLKTLQ